MRDFELPFMPSETPIVDAFGPMIERGVSGIVVGTGEGYRLLHFAQLKGALAAGLQTVGEIVGHVDLEARFARAETMEMQASGPDTTDVREIQFAPGSEYCLLNVDFVSGTALVCSRREPGAEMFLASTPGYGCDANPHHYYPPNRRGLDNSCVVLGCAGHLP
jgi:hypothetical protein